MITWHFMTSQNCFPGFCAVRNFFFQIFLFPLAFDSKDVLLENKTLKLRLILKGGYPVFAIRIYPNSKCHISAHIWDTEKKISAFKFPRIVLSKTIWKFGRFKSLKFTHEWRQQIWRHNLTFGVILWAILIGLMFRIFRPSLVGKEWKQAKLF